MDQNPQQPPQIKKPIPIILPPDETEKEEDKSVPRSTLIIFWIFIGYLALTFVAAVYFVTSTNVKIFNLNEIAFQSSNLPQKSIDLPICLPKTNQVALSSSVLENRYSGTVASFKENTSTESANTHSSITFQVGNELFTYFINKNDIGKLTFYDPRSISSKRGTIEGLKVGDSALIIETLNLNLPPQDSKTKIELEVL